MKNINYLLVIGNILIFIFFMITFYYMVKVMKKYRTINCIQNYMILKEKNRITGEEDLRKQEGIQEKTHFFYRIDLLLNQSGIKKKIHFASTEYLILFSTILAALTFVICHIAGLGFFSIFISFTNFLMPFFIVVIMAGINHRKVEEQIVHFLNMTENYSKTHDNIITIFGKIYPFMKEPLKSGLQECYIEATNTGDVAAAFRHLETSVVHEKFSEVLRNLEICGRYEANYQVIVAESRDIMMNYISSRKKVKNIVDDAKIDFLVLIGCMVILISVTDSFISGSLLEILMSGKIGWIILAYMLFVLLYGTVSMITIIKR